jgi:hypothetical protein
MRTLTRTPENRKSVGLMALRRRAATTTSMDTLWKMGQPTMGECLSFPSRFHLSAFWRVSGPAINTSPEQSNPSKMFQFRFEPFDRSSGFANHLSFIRRPAKRLQNKHKNQSNRSFFSALLACAINQCCLDFFPRFFGASLDLFAEGVRERAAPIQ